MDTQTLLEKDADGRVVLRWDEGASMARILAQYRYIESLPKSEQVGLWPMKEEFGRKAPPDWSVSDDEEPEEEECKEQEEPPKKPKWEPPEPPKSKEIQEFERWLEEWAKPLKPSRRADIGFPFKPRYTKEEEAERELEANISRYLRNFKKRRPRRYSTMSQREKSALLARTYACQICGAGRDGEKLVIEHDHSSDLVRGVVCEKCNHLPALLR